MQEKIFGNGRHGHETGGMGHAGCILGRAEYGNAVVGGSERLDAFVGLLTVVEARSHAMDTEIWVADELGRTPLICLEAVVGFDVTIYLG